MLNKVARFITNEKLITHDGLHIVALSGGADSVALLMILKQLGYRIEAAHCNFQLRGEESERDEVFVKALCKKLGISLHIAHFDTYTYADLHHVSIEMAARDLRYAYFNQLIEDIGAESICVAHHRDDAIETLLMNLLRGSGVHGLTGIRSKKGAVVRPLLCLNRQEIEEYLNSKGQNYVTDSTNFVDDVLRNKIRLQVLPLLNNIFPSASTGIDKTAGFMREAEKVLDESLVLQMKNVVKKDSLCAIDITKLLHLPSPKYFLHEWLNPYGFNTAQTDQIFRRIKGNSGREFISSKYILLIDREQLLLFPREAPMKSMKCPEPGLYNFNERLQFELVKTDNITICKSKDCALLDNSMIEFPLFVRPVETGDVFVPFGMTGHKLISDFLTDRKLSLFEKRKQLVVCNGEGAILWVVGQRIDNRYRVTPNTSEVLRITCIHSR